MNECNKLIKKMLTKNICDEELFKVFCLFAMKTLPFETVLKTAERCGVDFKRLVESQNLNYKLIKNGE